MEPGREGGTQKSSCFFQNITPALGNLPLPSHFIPYHFAALLQILRTATSGSPF